MKTLKESLLDDIDSQIEDQSTLYKDWIKEHYIVDGKLKFHDGIVDVDGSIEFKSWPEFTELTNGSFKFGKVTGDFFCNYGGTCNLTSLKGAPGYVGGIFDCSYCHKLTTLEGAPEYVGGDFYCSYCDKLKTLKGAPEYVGGDFNCRECKKLTSLKGAPEKIGGGFDCHSCIHLTSLEGAPEELLCFDCNNCKNLTSLEGAPKLVNGYFDCSHCNLLQTLDGAPKEVKGDFNCSDCKKLTDFKSIPIVYKNFICNSNADLKYYDRIKGSIIKKD